MTRSGAVLFAVLFGALAGGFATRTRRLVPSTLASQDTTAALVALGDSIFHGKAAKAICYTCHQANARGIKGIAPDLTDGTWLHGDGSIPSLMTTIERGVGKPKESPVPMPPWGGSKLSPVQLQAVAHYVASLRAGAK